MSFPQAMSAYRKQLNQGDVKQAYQGLMAYLNNLRMKLNASHPNFMVSDTVQPGCMDVSYFYFFPKPMKQLKLKVVIVFIHQTFTFEAWLSGYNKTVQAEYWSQFSKTIVQGAELASTPCEDHYLLRCTLADNESFKDLTVLSNKIESGALAFIDNIEAVLAGAA